MKIIQINAWLGYLIHPLIHLIEKEEPDVICMQEVLSSRDNIIFLDNINTHSKISKIFPHSFFSATHRFKVLGSDVKLGNAIYSAHPISEQQTTFINATYETNHNLNDVSRNVRNIQSCSLTLPNNKIISVANHHGYHDLNPLGNAKSIECMGRVIEHLKKLSSPVIFCGDLNLSPDSKPIKLLEQSLPYNNLVNKFSIKTTLSEVFRVENIQVVADYIFTAKDVSVKNFNASDQIVSDHKALVLEFDI